MSLFRRNATVEVAPAIIAKPLAVVPSVERASDAYEELAKEIGLASPALTKNKIMSWLSENAIKVYDENQVYQYLSKQINMVGQIAWLPLRKTDYSVGWWFWKWEGNDVRIGMDSTIYSQAVPLHALRLVRDMEMAMGKESMSFFVSDVTRNRTRLNDPFLAVSPRNNLGDITIIDMWDEPNWK